jgi:hypothetical protein
MKEIVKKITKKEFYYKIFENSFNNNETFNRFAENIPTGFIKELDCPLFIAHNK